MASKDWTEERHERAKMLYESVWPASVLERQGLQQEMARLLPFAVREIERLRPLAAEAEHARRCSDATVKAFSEMSRKTAWLGDAPCAFCGVLVPAGEGARIIIEGLEPDPDVRLAYVAHRTCAARWAKTAGSVSSAGCPAPPGESAERSVNDGE
jgi:hypothetical protein